MLLMVDSFIWLETGLLGYALHPSIYIGYCVLPVAVSSVSYVGALRFPYLLFCVRQFYIGQLLIFLQKYWRFNNISSTCTCYKHNLNNKEDKRKEDKMPDLTDLAGILFTNYSLISFLHFIIYYILSYDLGKV